MTKDEIQDLVKKIRLKSSKCFSLRNDEKATLYERMADDIELNMDCYVNDNFFTTEDDILEEIKNNIEESDNFYDKEDYEDMDMLD